MTKEGDKQNVRCHMGRSIVLTKKIFKELIIFFLLANILSWIFWIPSFLYVAGIGQNLPHKLFETIGNFMPSIVGILITYVALGREGLKRLLKGLLKVRFSVVWYLYAFLLMPTILFIAYLLSYLISGLEFQSLLAPIILPKVWPIFLLILYFVVMQGPLGEEIGWRGYALPRLFELFNPLKSSIILGFIWSIWHFPKFFLEGSTQYALTEAYGVIVALVGYTVFTIILTILITFLFIKTKGSILSVMIFHAMSNFSHGLITILTEPIGGVCILVVMGAVVGLVLRGENKKVLSP